MIEFKLIRRGRRHCPIYDVVVAEKRKKSDGKYIEKIGLHDPLKPNNSFINDALAMHWLGVGAQMTTTAHSILSKSGILKAFFKERKRSDRKSEEKEKQSKRNKL